MYLQRFTRRLNKDAEWELTKKSNNEITATGRKRENIENKKYGLDLIRRGAGRRAHNDEIMIELSSAHDRRTRGCARRRRRV